MSVRRFGIPRAPSIRGGGEMSLINEMLRDLEARRAGELARPDLQREIRPLPGGAAKGRTLWPWLMVALILVAGGATAWRYGEVPEGWSWSAPPAKVAAVVPSPPPSVASPEPSAAALSDALRMAEALENPPAEAESAPTPGVATPAAAPAPSAAESAKTAAETAKPPAPQMVKGEASPTPAKIAPVKPKVTESVLPTGSVEKTSAQPSAHERADGEYRRAIAFLAAGQTGPAADALRAALKIEASYAAPRQLLFKVLLESHRVDEGIQVLSEGLELQPHQIGWAMSLARLLVDRGDLAGAEKILARHRSAAAGSAEYAGFHGHLLLRQGRARDAVDAYQQATRLTAADGRWWFGLGQSLEADGRANEGREAFRRALASGNLNADLAALAEQKLRSGG